MSEEPEEGQKKEEGERREEEQKKEAERPGRVKHERLKQERDLEAKHKEKSRDFKKSLTKRGKHLFDRKRKEKFIGGTRGRRGG